MLAADSNVAIVLVSLVGVVGASIVGPLIAGHVANRNRDKQWERDDEVAARLVAQNALTQQAAVATSRKVDTVVHKVDGIPAALDAIHGLVNSHYTASLQAQYDTLATNLALMLEMVAERRENGKEPTAEALAAIDATTAKLAELATVLDERHRQDAVAQAKLDTQGEEGRIAQVQKDAADTQQSAAALQSEAADKQIQVAEGQAAVATEQAAVAERQAQVADKQSGDTG